MVKFSGQLKKPGVYEVKMGENLKSIIEDLAGGMLVGKKLKAVIPGGSSVPILKANEININYAFCASLVLHLVYKRRRCRYGIFTSFGLFL